MQYSSGKDYLSKLTDARKLTPEGRDWLTLALDPFHDYNHQVAGYPDANCSQTVVSCYQYQVEVAAPSGIAPNTNWDAHIYNMPICRTDNFGVFILEPGWTNIKETAPVINDCTTGPLNIVTNASGSPLGVVVPKSPTASKTALPSTNAIYDLCDGITRVIGLGFEVTNTTAEISKQGTTTAYRMPQLGSDYQIGAANAAGTFVAPVTGQMWREPPSTPAQANLLKGTRTWSAAEGIYATCFQNSVHNPLSQVESSQIMFTSTSSPGAASNVRASYFNTVGPAATAPNASTVSFAPNQVMPFDTTGVFFTGLSYTTTLTVKLRVYVERAPTFTEPNLAVLASPSAGYDVRALELYATAINLLPVAVKVGENAKGDWWRAVVGVLKAAAGPIGMALNPFLPGAGILGAGVQAVAGQINTGKGKSIANESMKKMTAEMSKMADTVKRLQPNKPKLKPKASKPAKKRP